MSSEGSVVVLVHWNGVLTENNNEVNYSTYPNAALFLSDDTTYARLCESVMQEMSRDGFYDMKTIHGKFPIYNSEGICVSSMLWPIHDDPSWIYFLQFARNQYERAEIYINAEKKQMVHPSQQRTSRRPPNQDTSQPMIDVNVPHDVSDSDDDPDYNALSFSEHESSSEDSDD
ncbi:unnamed protein product, partial [Cuscuta epithymum]